jgi:hypothetical protein
MLGFDPRHLRLLFALANARPVTNTAVRAY